MQLKQFALFATESILIMDQLNIAMIGLVTAENPDLAATSLGLKLSPGTQTYGYYGIERGPDDTWSLWLHEIFLLNQQNVSHLRSSAMSAPLVISTDKGF